MSMRYGYLTLSLNCYLNQAELLPEVTAPAQVPEVAELQRQLVERDRII